MFAKLDKFRLRHMAAAALCIGIGACQQSSSTINVADVDYRAKFPIRVESDLVQANFSGTGAGTLSLEELVELDRLVNDYVVRGQKPLLIVMPGSALQHHNLASELERRAMEHNLAKSEVLVGVDPEAAMNGAVTVSYLVHTAIGPDCGYWHDDATANFDNTNSPNFGCAAQHNLALMVANPGDLVSSRTFTTRDAQRTVAILQAYKVGENPQADWPSDDTRAPLDIASDN